MEKTEVCIYHIAELYLYEYYSQPGDYVIQEEDRVTPLLQKAEEEEKRGGLMGALQCYERALEWNPACTQAMFKKIDCLFRLNNLDELYKATLAVYPYCATRAEMAQYYRWLGYYFLERYQPELSQVVYKYSTYFALSKQADSEIAYLEDALGKPMPNYTAEELQEKLWEAKIPTSASAVTLALLYRAAEEAQAAGQADQALDCYRMVYDLSADAEVAERIRQLG